MGEILPIVMDGGELGQNVAEGWVLEEFGGCTCFF
jgi:hypothetical protein